MFVSSVRPEEPTMLIAATQNSKTFMVKNLSNLENESSCLENSAVGNEIEMETNSLVAFLKINNQ